MITLIKTDAKHRDFLHLVNLLNQDLAVRNGEDHEFYMQFNGLEDIDHVVLAYSDGKVVGCGAMKEFEERIFEVKRMYVLQNQRGKGVATKVLQELEEWGVAMNLKALVLETGLMLPEAIGLYEKYGFDKTPNYGQYIGNEDSVCFRKELKARSYES
ncbi:GNAT family N-acetyltransferase [Flammeovirga sp. OC4]|uniref:GNAT family N-acetyltransferase n=1 Tax=Flammeovirga sp. OC4 TaxID=1382345 RepID=UPI0005C63ACC|nr:GNAT family N-acetyltransferase [Flammeovirga sp. OC4]